MPRENICAMSKKSITLHVNDAEKASFAYAERILSTIVYNRIINF